MSAAQRKRISEAMKPRYAAMKVANMAAAPAKVNKAPVGGSRLTAAGRKKLSDLMKKRWAERRTENEIEVIHSIRCSYLTPKSISSKSQNGIRCSLFRFAIKLIAIQP